LALILLMLTAADVAVVVIAFTFKPNI
jgi:hypothetical protein